MSEDLRFRFPLAVIDFEATALSLESWPIEVGIAVAPSPDGPVEIWSSLILPDPAWDIAAQWDPDAQRVHGINRRDLRDGRAPAGVLAELNARLEPPWQVWCDGGPYDRHWLDCLVNAAGIPPRFELVDLAVATRQDNALRGRYRDALTGSPPHRAGPDAERICRALLQALRQAG
ncbi:hypothetical protein ACFOD9_12290 [Novosphingobium bradum]|uniref:Exonuclease domain-containing protein n=1 Tax=Novosphingobium bradum TaxID=1737444 RepID=A0ABV7IU12_9SPHN